MTEGEKIPSFQEWIDAKLHIPIYMYRKLKQIIHNINFLTVFLACKGRNGPPEGWANLCSSRIFRWHFISFVNLIFGFYCLHWIHIPHPYILWWHSSWCHFTIQISWANIFTRFQLNDFDLPKRIYIFHHLNIRFDFMNCCNIHNIQTFTLWWISI